MKILGRGKLPSSSLLAAPRIDALVVSDPGPLKTRLLDQISVLSRVLGVRGRGRDLQAAVERLDLEGIVAKRLGDPYTPETVWRKVKNRAYTQMEGRAELFHPKPR